jgi:hypothetical protein
VIAGDRCVQDLKVPKHRREKIREMARTLKAKVNEETFESMFLAIGEVEVRGILKHVETATENGEEIIVFRF